MIKPNDMNLPTGLNREPELLMADPKTLFFDHEHYQRPPNLQQVKNISPYNPDLADYLICNLRDDGTTACIDGQHRCISAIASNVPQVHIKLYYGLTIAEEALHWVIRNNKQRKPTALDDYFARIAAKQEPAITIQRILSSLDLFIPRSASSQANNGIVCVKSLEDVLRISGPEGLAYILALLKETWPNQHMAFKKGMVEGMEYFHRKYGTRIDRAEVVKKFGRDTAENVCRAAENRQNAYGTSKGSYCEQFVLMYDYSKPQKTRLEPDILA